MALVRFPNTYADDAAVTLAADITSSDLAITLTNDFVFKSGYTSGQFAIEIHDQGTDADNSEWILLDDYPSALSLTVNASGRGYESTTAHAHVTGDPVSLVLLEADLLRAFLQNLMTATGSLIVGTGSGTYDELLVGTDGQIPYADSGEPTGIRWDDPPGGMTNPMTTQDDLIVGGASGVPARLAKGSDGQVLTVDPSTHHLVWATPGGGSSPLTTKGDLWGYSTLDARIPVGSDGDVLTADSGDALGVSWQTPSGGGGAFAHSYKGYNTIGGSTENVTNYRVYLKKITLASDGFIGSIGAYLNQASDDAFAMQVGVLSDIAGAPGLLLAHNGQTINFSFLLEDSATPTYAATWEHMPIGLWAPAGDYWIAVQFWKTGGTLNLAYDGSGSDRYYTAGDHVMAHYGRYTGTIGSNKYSIRASVLS